MAKARSTLLSKLLFSLLLPAYLGGAIPPPPGLSVKILANSELIPGQICWKVPRRNNDQRQRTIVLRATDNDYAEVGDLTSFEPTHGGWVLASEWIGPPISGPKTKIAWALIKKSKLQLDPDTPSITNAEELRTKIYEGFKWDFGEWWKGPENKLVGDINSYSKKYLPMIYLSPTPGKIPGLVDVGVVSSHSIGTGLMEADASDWDIKFPTAEVSITSPTDSPPRSGTPRSGSSNPVRITWAQIQKSDLRFFPSESIAKDVVDEINEAFRIASTWGRGNTWFGPLPPHTIGKGEDKEVVSPEGIAVLNVKPGRKTLIEACFLVNVDRYCPPKTYMPDASNYKMQITTVAQKKWKVTYGGKMDPSQLSGGHFAPPAVPIGSIAQLRDELYTLSILETGAIMLARLIHVLVINHQSERFQEVVVLSLPGSDGVVEVGIIASSRSSKLWPPLQPTDLGIDLLETDQTITGGRLIKAVNLRKARGLPRKVKSEAVQKLRETLSDNFSQAYIDLRGRRTQPRGPRPKMIPRRPSYKRLLSSRV